MAIYDRLATISPAAYEADLTTTRSNLAGVLLAAGDVGRAVTLYERVLADSERVLGSDHRNTLILRANLAGAYMSLGDVGRAVTLYERVLADSERVLGSDHRNTLILRA
ncbi:tetratricopeptide repeat protein, partial [Microbispora sp. NPDC049125]|uniref:tetratricopeptide repeat protein n=1 Tax=Microbispora sp. NPDC049125 TaxID=3154929 RepID=UPI003467BDF8